MADDDGLPRPTSWRSGAFFATQIRAAAVVWEHHAHQHAQSCNARGCSYGTELACVSRNHNRTKGYGVFDVEFFRRLCTDIATETDPRKIDDLLDLLRALIRDNQEDIRARAIFLAKKYEDALREISP